jgi:hypothetical protein
MDYYSKYKYYKKKYKSYTNIGGVNRDTKVKVSRPCGEGFDIPINKSETIFTLKLELSRLIGVPINRQILYNSESVLENDDKVDDNRELSLIVRPYNSATIFEINKHLTKNDAMTARIEEEMDARIRNKTAELERAHKAWFGSAKTKAVKMREIVQINKEKEEELLLAEEWFLNDQLINELNTTYGDVLLGCVPGDIIMNIADEYRCHGVYIIDNDKKIQKLGTYPDEEGSIDGTIFSIGPDYPVGFWAGSDIVCHYELFDEPLGIDQMRLIVDDDNDKLTNIKMTGRSILDQLPEDRQEVFLEIYGINYPYLAMEDSDLDMLQDVSIINYEWGELIFPGTKEQVIEKLKECVNGKLPVYGMVIIPSGTNNIIGKWYCYF